MATREPTLTERIAMGLGQQAAIMILCDDCGRPIDAVSGHWLECVEAGELYAGDVRCWRCHEAWMATENEEA